MEASSSHVGSTKDLSLGETKTTKKVESKTFSLPLDKHLLAIQQREDFDNILKEAGERLIMFEFFAPWCGPCKILTPKLEDMALKYEGKLLIVKIDVDEFEDLAMDHNVTAMPTFMIMKNKRVLQQFSSSNLEHLQEAVEKYAGKPAKVEETEMEAGQ